MNGFPYWQFHNDRWLTGKISSLDLDAQGLFLHFCMTAWSSQGVFNICLTSVRLRFRKTAEWIAETISAMVEVGIIVPDGVGYRIKFIDQQLDDLQKIRGKKSKAGKASAAARSSLNTENTEENSIVEKSIVEKSSVLKSVQHTLNGCSTSVQPEKPKQKSFKQWNFDDLMKSVCENNADSVITEAQAKEFCHYWIDEKDGNGKSKLHTMKTWSTRLRIKNAKRIVFDNEKFGTSNQRQPSLWEIEKSLELLLNKAQAEIYAAPEVKKKTNDQIKALRAKRDTLMTQQAASQ